MPSITSRVSNLPSYLGQIGPKWDKSGTFLRSVSVHFDSASQNILKLILKSPRFVPFAGNLNLTQFGCPIRHPWNCLLWQTGGPVISGSGNKPSLNLPISLFSKPGHVSLHDVMTMHRLDASVSTEMHIKSDYRVSREVQQDHKVGLTSCSEHFTFSALFIAPSIFNGVVWGWSWITEELAQTKEELLERHLPDWRDVTDGKNRQTPTTRASISASTRHRNLFNFPRFFFIRSYKD